MKKQALLILRRKGWGVQRRPEGFGKVAIFDLVPLASNLGIGELTISIPSNTDPFLQADYKKRHEVEAYCLPPGSLLGFQAISFRRGGEIRLISRTQTATTIAAFITALEMLPDISDISQTPKRVVPSVLPRPRQETTFDPRRRGRFRCNQTGGLFRKGHTGAYRRSRTNSSGSEEPPFCCWAVLLRSCELRRDKVS